MKTDTKATIDLHRTPQLMTTPDKMEELEKKHLHFLSHSHFNLHISGRSAFCEVSISIIESLNMACCLPIQQPNIQTSNYLQWFPNPNAIVNHIPLPIYDTKCCSIGISVARRMSRLSVSLYAHL